MSLHSEWMNTFGEEEVEDTAQSKDVAFWRFFLSELIVSQKWQQFGSQPATGALDDAGHRDTFLVEPFAESKIWYFQVDRRIIGWAWDQNVVRFDVAMKETLLVHVLKSVSELKQGRPLRW